jgi:hypothetical protein
MRLQKAKKLTKNSSLLPQTPNRKQALREMARSRERSLLSIFTTKNS